MERTPALLQSYEATLCQRHFFCRCETVITRTARTGAIHRKPIILEIQQAGNTEKFDRPAARFIRSWFLNQSRKLPRSHRTQNLVAAVTSDFILKSIVADPITRLNLSASLLTLLPSGSIETSLQRCCLYQMQSFPSCLATNQVHWCWDWPDHQSQELCGWLEFLVYAVGQWWRQSEAQVEWAPQS